MNGFEPTTSARDPRLPTGTVTFVFTDIEGSTARWERHPIAMRSALRRHDALVRDGIESHGGHVFKTVGDAFCAVFARAQDAVAAVASLQIALAAEDFSAVDGLRVRYAIHSGTADERDRDFFGPAVNRVARLLAAANGGQALVSERASDLARPALPRGTSLRDLGEHRLKDLIRPERIFQLVTPGCERRFAPLRSISTVPNNLPSQLTALLGREDEVAAVSALSSAHRLVTIVGSGGIGKTRTSLQVGADAFDVARDGVWFVELAPLTSGAYVPAAIAIAMGSTLDDVADPLATLAATIGAKHVLLVLDNCEHVLDAAGRTIGALSRACPNLRVLASSRERLGIAGERTFRLPSLPIPPGGVGVLEAGRFTAVALFVERAVAVDDRFALTGANAAAVADICRRLDGIPLAIELAAARVKILRPRQLRERLDERFRILVGGGRDLLPRQRTLRALIDWSYDLLDDRERTLFRRLGVFVDGFTIEGAAAVGGDGSDVSHVLASLVEKSLVVVDADVDRTARYRMLESTRAYALEIGPTNERTAARTTRLRYLRDAFARERETSDRTGTSASVRAALTTELEEVRAALDAAEAPGDVTTGSELLVAIANGWDHTGRNVEGIERIARFVERLGPGQDRLAARLWRTRAELEGSQYRPSAVAAARRAVGHARTDGDPGTLAATLVTFASCLARSGALDDAVRALAEAVPIVPPENVLLRFVRLDTAAMLAGRAGRLDDAAAAWAEIHATQLALGHLAAAAYVAINLAEAEHRRGRTRDAATLVEEALPILGAGQNTRVLLGAQANLSGYLLALDRYEDAGALLRRTLLACDTAGSNEALLAIAIDHAALAIALAGDVRVAARLTGFAAAVIERETLARDYGERATRTRLAGVLSAGLAPHELEGALAAGADLPADAAVRLALESRALGDAIGR